MKTNMIKSKEFQAYQKYLKRVDSLSGIARMPYMTVVENPPDLRMQYLRKLTYNEFIRNKSMRMEFLNESL